MIYIKNEPLPSFDGFVFDPSAAHYGACGVIKLSAAIGSISTGGTSAVTNLKG